MASSWIVFKAGKREMKETDGKTVFVSLVFSSSLRSAKWWNVWLMKAWKFTYLNEMSAFRRPYHWGQEWNENWEDGKLESGFEKRCLLCYETFRGVSSLLVSFAFNPVLSSMHSRQSQLQQIIWNGTTTRFAKIRASLKFHLRVEFEASFHKLNWLSKTATGNKLIINCKQMPRFFKHGVSNLSRLRVSFFPHVALSLRFFLPRWQQARHWSWKTKFR